MMSEHTGTPFSPQRSKNAIRQNCRRDAASLVAFPADMNAARKNGGRGWTAFATAARLRRVRSRSSRFAIENERIEAWFEKAVIALLPRRLRETGAAKKLTILQEATLTDDEGLALVRAVRTLAGIIRMDEPASMEKMG